MKLGSRQTAGLRHIYGCTREGDENHPPLRTADQRQGGHDAGNLLDFDADFAQLVSHLIAVDRYYPQTSLARPLYRGLPIGDRLETGQRRSGIGGGYEGTDRRPQQTVRQDEIDSLILGVARYDGRKRPAISNGMLGTGSRHIGIVRLLAFP